MNPIDPQELGAYVNDCMNPDTCCHDLMHTNLWLIEHGWNEAEVTAWAARQGIACDCETINSFYKKDVFPDS